MDRHIQIVHDAISVVVAVISVPRQLELVRRVHRVSSEPVGFALVAHRRGPRDADRLSHGVRAVAHRRLDVGAGRRGPFALIRALRAREPRGVRRDPASLGDLGPAERVVRRERFQVEINRLIEVREPGRLPTLLLASLVEAQVLAPALLREGGQQQALLCCPSTFLSCYGCLWSIARAASLCQCRWARPPGRARTI